VVSADPQQLVTSRDFDEDRHIASRSDRHPNHRNLDAERFIGLVVDTQAVVLAAGFPPFELDDQLDALGRSR
jgi:hypothetical protein